MSMKFDLTVANWLAYVIDPAISASKLSYDNNEKEMLELFLGKMIHGISSFYDDIGDPEGSLDSWKQLLQSLDETSISEDFYAELRGYLGKKQWIALIIPSGIDQTVDGILCDPGLLKYLVKAASNNQGLILQLEEAPSTISTLLNIYPALRTALNEVVNWPGILIWSPGGDSVFLPISSLDFIEMDIEARVQWIFSKLATELAFDLGRLKFEYKDSFPEIFEHENKTINILHLSDLDIGNNFSNRRMSRVRQFIRHLVEELGDRSKIVPIITGNLMDNPGEKHINQIRSFWNFLSELGTEEPLFVLGKNDVRKDGNLNENYRNAVGFPVTKVIWYNEEKLGLICVDSVMRGKLERGSINVNQLADIEYEIERKNNFEDYKLVMLLHHHPVTHPQQDDITQAFYDKIIGAPLESIEALDGSKLLLDFVKQHSISAILHGQGHIPRISKVGQNVSVVGCGSSIGKISQSDGSVYFSVNLLSINEATQKISARLLAYRKPESGLTESRWHEIIFRALT